MQRNLEELSAMVVDAGYHLHRELGPGLLESVYEAVLAHVAPVDDWSGLRGFLVACKSVQEPSYVAARIEEQHREQQKPWPYE